MTTLPASWDYETDVLIFGSGCAGFSAAIYARQRGLEVLVCEKMPVVGGTTATAGGFAWVPLTRQALAAGAVDSYENARTYLQAELGPHYRADLRGQYDHPLNIQYRGELAQLETLLQQQGWQAPPRVNGVSWMLWLNPATPLTDMPVLPQVHDGRYNQLLLTRMFDEQLFAIRLWQSPYRIGSDREPLWLGNITQLKVVTQGGLSAPRTQDNFDEVLAQFQQHVAGIEAITRHSGQTEEQLRFSLRDN